MSHTARPSGAELAMKDLASALRGRGVDVHFLVLEDGDLVDWAASNSYPVDVVNLGDRAGSSKRHSALKQLGPRSLDVVRCSRHVRHVLATRRVDVLHSNSLKSHVVAGLAVRGSRARSVWHIRDLVGVPHVSALEARGFQAAAHLADAIACVSQACAAPFARFSPTILPSAVRVERFLSLARVQSLGRRPVSLVAIGRIADWKGQHVVLQAVSLLGTRGFPVRLTVAGAPLFGEAAYLDHLREMAADLDCTFVGHVEDVEVVLSGADVLIHSSVLAEPFGKVIVEAMAGGRLVIATEGGGPTDILIGPMRECLVPRNDPAAIADQLMRFAADGSQVDSMTQALRQRALRYDADVVADEAIQLYTSLLSDRRVSQR